MQQCGTWHPSAPIIPIQPIWNATTDLYAFNQGDAEEVKELADFMVRELTVRGILK